jgi:hypothetical protein
MAALVPKANPDAPRLVVADDSVAYWTERGYVLAEGESAKPAKKTAAKRSASKK